MRVHCPVLWCPWQTEVCPDRELRLCMSCEQWETEQAILYSPPRVENEDTTSPRIKISVVISISVSHSNPEEMEDERRCAATHQIYVPQRSNCNSPEFGVEHDRNTWLKGSMQQAITQGCVVLIQWVAQTSYRWSNHLGHSLVFKCPTLCCVIHDLNAILDKWTHK